MAASHSIFKYKNNYNEGFRELHVIPQSKQNNFKMTVQETQVVMGAGDSEDAEPGQAGKGRGHSWQLTRVHQAAVGPEPPEQTWRSCVQMERLLRWTEFCCQQSAGTLAPSLPGRVDSVGMRVRALVRGEGPGEEQGPCRPEAPIPGLG